MAIFTCIHSVINALLACNGREAELSTKSYLEKQSDDIKQ
jgi:hypothetical protein